MSGRLSFSSQFSRQTQGHNRKGFFPWIRYVLKPFISKVKISVIPISLKKKGNIAENFHFSNLDLRSRMALLIADVQILQYPNLRGILECVSN